MSDSTIVESEVESHLRRRVESLGGMCLKILPDYSRGIPDRLVLLPGGKTIWVETKRPKGGRISPAQMVSHLKLRRVGQRVELVWTKKQADDLLSEST